DRAIKIETDKLEAVIPKKNPKQWMTGIEKGSFLDKTTGFREIGDGLMVIDWLMEPGSDAAWKPDVFGKDGHGVGRYSWHENETDEIFLRNDTPGCVRHDKGDTFSEMYLSYLSGPKGVRIPSKEFFEPFPPDLKFGYRRDTHKTPKHFIRAYHLRDKKTGKDGPWLAGLTLAPSVVYEAWCSQRPGGIIVMIQEIHGKPVKAGESFSAAHIVGYFDTIEEMHQVYDRYKGHTALSADSSGWRLLK